MREGSCSLDIAVEFEELGEEGKNEGERDL